eukprot:GHRR01036354.1.p1 GENE.GHRR01036354.1~~GHRR01036354.1.p1  ORF type:complete len:137 (-),score=28.13 GHRR01036354.1:166-576(-)
MHWHTDMGGIVWQHTAFVLGSPLSYSPPGLAVMTGAYYSTLNPAMSIIPLAACHLPLLSQLQQQLKREPVLSSFDLAGVAELICSGKAKHIVVMCGAGISVSAGIPDFRTPGTGLYSQVGGIRCGCLACWQFPQQS